MVRATVARIGHVGISVRDMDETLAFYTDVLGLRLTERFTYPEDEVGHGTAVAAGAFVRCDSTHHCISFFVLKEPAARPEGVGLGLHHLAFEFNTPGELLEVYRRFRDGGHQIVNARRGGPGNQPRFYGRDPDGNLLEFYWGIDAIGWDGMPREYTAIEEIDLEAFDFEAFLETRERHAQQARARTTAGLAAASNGTAPVEA
jgi:catechol 2,3-dioxygenase-like lactoylglutathione lyase family enzyme